jgi:hypothetical protein
LDRTDSWNWPGKQGGFCCKKARQRPQAGNFFLKGGQPVQPPPTNATPVGALLATAPAITISNGQPRADKSLLESCRVPPFELKKVLARFSHYCAQFPNSPLFPIYERF